MGDPDNIIEHMNDLKKVIIDLKLSRGEIGYPEYYALLNKYPRLIASKEYNLKWYRECDQWVFKAENFIRKMNI